MKTLYFCSWDGDLRFIFKNEEKAYAWQSETGKLAFVNEVIYDDNNNNKIISVNDKDFTDWIESISGCVGTSEFLCAKAAFEKRWAFTEVTDD